MSTVALGDARATTDSPPPCPTPWVGVPKLDAHLLNPEHPLHGHVRLIAASRSKRSLRPPGSAVRNATGQPLTREHADLDLPCSANWRASARSETPPCAARAGRQPGRKLRTARRAYASTG